MLDLFTALLMSLTAPTPFIEGGAAAEQTAIEPIAAAAFLEGRWVGTGMGGDVEEIWSPAQSDQMVGHFTYARAGKPVFYELLLIRPDDEGGLEMLVKHFNADFTAWEDKNEWVTFRADATGSGKALSFKGLKIELVDGVLTSIVTMKKSDGNLENVPFVMTRVPD